jgi:hypothetical protein
MMFPMLLSVALSAGLADSARDVPSLDTVLAGPLPTTTVVGVRSVRAEKLDQRAWSSPTGLGQAGPLETFRDRPGNSGQGEFSGRVASAGMPHEGGLVTWDGAEIPWPWHFGGLFGALDADATGQVKWDPSGTGPSPARGGGWLETSSKANSDGPDGVHGSLELGTISGSAGIWGRRDDWSFQATMRRTWLEPVLELAHHEGWSAQEMVVMFWDATAALAWNDGPWSVHAGLFASRDTLSIGSADEGVVSSWRNLAVPVGATWRNDAWEVGADAAWSRFERRDEDLPDADTLDLVSATFHVRRNLSNTSRMEAGLRLRRWTSAYTEADTAVPGFPGDRSRDLVEPWISGSISGGPWTAELWGGLARDERDAAAPQGGLRVTHGRGPWTVQADLVHKIVPLGIVGNLGDGTESPSPVWFLPCGASPRTTAILLSATEIEAGTEQAPATELRALGWARSTEGLWNWEGIWSSNQFPAMTMLHRSYRQDGWSAGLDASGRIRFPRLELGARQTVSWDVVRRRDQDGTSFPLQWAPWDQRFQTEFDVTWAWLGDLRGRPGETFLRTRFVLRRSSGTPRSDLAGWSAPSTAQDLDTAYYSWKRVSGLRRAPYLRLDLTPVEFGRNGSWTVFWSIVNLTNEKNTIGWFTNDPADPVQKVDQIPFLPVVFGVRIFF